MKTLILLILAIGAGLAQADSERIHPDNVSRLTVAWTYDTRDSTAPLGKKPPGFQATPVYDSGRLYLSSPQGTVAALNADTGAEIWRADLSVRRDANYSDPQNRGPALRGDRLYVGTVDGRLVCLETESGRRCPRFGRNGEIDLTQGLRRPPEWRGEYGVTSPPAIFNDLVIVGSSVADNSRAWMASGEVRAFDAVTGTLRWTFHPLPADAQTGGANTWSRIVVDQPRGLVLLGTSSPSPDYFGGLRRGLKGYANSLVALRGATGEVVWHFQTVHHDLWDYDLAAPPLLFPFRTRDGRKLPAVVAGSKSGNAFFFNRMTGEPLFAIEERPVPASDVPGEQASPTQPFPRLPASFGLQQLRESDIWGPTPEDRDACLRTFHSLRNEGVYTPPSLQGTLVVPGNIGGLHWGGMAWDPTHRLIIAPINTFPAIVRLIPRAQLAAAAKAFPSRETTEQKGTPYAMSREFFFGPSGAPCVRPPWGELVAVHADTGDRAWSVPLGDARGFTPDGDNSALGSPNLGGPVTTETGLVFIGAALDPYLRAFDTRTGREVWKGRLPTSARATPVVFVSKIGRQMVAIAAGGHASAVSRIDTKLVVFGLGPSAK